MHATASAGLRNPKPRPKTLCEALEKEGRHGLTHAALLVSSCLNRLVLFHWMLVIFLLSYNNCRDSFLGFDTQIAKPTDQRKKLRWAPSKTPELKINCKQCCTAYLCCSETSDSVNLYVAAWSLVTEIWPQCSVNVNTGRKIMTRNVFLSQHRAEPKYSQYFPAPSDRKSVV